MIVCDLEKYSYLAFSTPLSSLIHLLRKWFFAFYFRSSILLLIKFFLFKDSTFYLWIVFFLSYNNLLDDWTMLWWRTCLFNLWYEAYSCFSWCWRNNFSFLFILWFYIINFIYNFFLSSLLWNLVWLYLILEILYEDFMKTFFFLPLFSLISVLVNFPNNLLSSGDLIF